jgi:hypothetical protein
MTSLGELNVEDKKAALTRENSVVEIRCTIQ